MSQWCNLIGKLLRIKSGQHEYNDNNICFFLQGCTNQYKQRLGNRWKHGRTFGASRYGGDDKIAFYPSWVPGSWNSVCISASAGHGWFRVVINDELQFETRDYTGDGGYSYSPANISLLNEIGHFGGHPAHGAVSDVHIWSRTLSRAEVRAWSHCQGSLAGDVLAWDTVELVIDGDLQQGEVETAEVCLTNGDVKVYRAFNLSLTFSETEKFCRNLGGVMAVADSQETLGRMRAAHSESCGGGGGGLYSGYTDREEEGQWRDVNTGAGLAWNHWEQFGPNNFYQADCGLLSPQSGLFYDTLCSEPACPVCQLSGQRPRLMLRGLCSHLTADRFYYMAASHSEFLGHLNTKLAFSPRRERWELVEMWGDQETLAFMLETGGNKKFPLGLQAWQFLHLNCSDSPGSNRTQRSLSFHLDVEQPGHFCCDDGTCIDSELVYDEFLDCSDSSDEENITFILLPETYNNLWPPVSLVNGRKELFNIYMKFTVIDIFDINEEEAYFDISFLIQMRWYDHEITFQFLKNNQGERHQKF